VYVILKLTKILYTCRTAGTDSKSRSSRENVGQSLTFDTSWSLSRKLSCHSSVLC